MNEQRSLSAQEMVEIAIERYFEVLHPDRIDEILLFFEHDAQFTLYPSQREYTGHDQIRSMYASVFERHGHIERKVTSVICDEARQCLAASFRGIGQAAKSGAPQIMHNVNIWHFSGPRFRLVQVFTSDPRL